jgi:hypothetical protein
LAEHLVLARHLHRNFFLQEVVEEEVIATQFQAVMAE